MPHHILAKQYCGNKSFKNPSKMMVEKQSIERDGSKQLLDLFLKIFHPSLGDSKNCHESTTGIVGV